jgi:hypothetical protein
MSGGSPLNNIPPALLQLLVQRLMQQQGQQGGGIGSMQGPPQGFAPPQNPQAMAQAANAQPTRSDIATGLPMGNSGMMQPGMQQLLALRDASLAQPQGAAAGAGPAAGSMLPGGAPAAKQPQVQPPKMPSMKKGGMVKKTGPHFLHKGERVVPAAKVSAKGKPKAAMARPPVKHAAAKSAPVRTPIKHASAKHKGRK